MPRRISLTHLQRGELVLRLLRKEATASELAREHSISENTLYKWRIAFLEAGLSGLDVTRDSKDFKAPQRELAEREQEVGEQRVAIRVLKKELGALQVHDELREQVKAEREVMKGKTRLVEVLKHLGVASTTWYRKPNSNPKPRGRPRKPLNPARTKPIQKICKTYPSWGYKRIAVIARRDLDPSYSDREVYRIMRAYALLQKRKPRKKEPRQKKRLYTLLPRAPNKLWQMDVTYLYMPQSSWWYVVTVIDYYSRYLLACELGPSQNAQSTMAALDVARAEAESLRGPLTKELTLVTDNGPCFTACKFQRHIIDFCCHVRIRYRTPQQLGLLERFHLTLKTEEAHWNMYTGPEQARLYLAAFRERYNQVRPHWALRPTDKADPLTPIDVYLYGCYVIIPPWQDWARNWCRTSRVTGLDIDETLNTV